MSEIHIDSIVVRETRDRLSSSVRNMKEGEAAADALLWFSSRIKAGATPSEMFSLTATAGNSSGTEKEASVLLQAAAQHFHNAILEKAVGIAQARLGSAEKARKESAQ